MTEIDWSKAPEGATHCTPAFGINTRPVFWRVKGGVARECWVMAMDFSDVLDHFRYGPDGCTGYYKGYAIARPEAAWTGEGLPPVGTVCEYLFSEGDEWRSCAVVAHYEGRAVVCDLLDDASERVQERNLRPIRTPEQIAAAEREKSVNEIAGILGSLWSSELEAAGFLYDAGYRKIEGGAQ